MKIKKIAIFALLAPICAQAEILTPADALQRAAESLPVAIAPARRAAALRNSEPLMTIGAGSPEVYVFGSAAGGLMVASAESETPALLGYSPAYEPGQPLPPALEMMIEAYAAEIAGVRRGDVVKTASERSRADYAEIEPICKTTWDQRAPYNNLTPTIDGRPTVTGCVATAIAQVLKTYEYPQKGTGVCTYFWGGGNKSLSLDFDQITFDWANMLNSYASNGNDPEVSKTAVATLMMACGYASEMDFGTEASGANGQVLASGLVRYFGFDPALQYLERRFFSLSEWQDRVYGELAAGRPLYYDGSSINKEGHAFVVDGYRSEGYFHLNWGWGGLADGYFLLTALDPASQGTGGAASGAGFDLRQGAIFGLKPNSGIEQSQVSLLFYTQGTFAINTSSITLGSNISVSYTCYNGGNFTVERVSPALCFTAENGTRTYTKSSTVYSPIDPFSGFNFGALPTPAGLAPGDYTVTPMVYSHVSDKYFPSYGPLALGQSVAATVSGSRITFNGTLKPELWSTHIEAPEVIAPRRDFRVNFTVNNNSSVPYTGNMYLALCKEGKTVVKAYVATFVANLDGCSSEEITMTANLANVSFAEGDYDLYLLDSNRDIISNPARVTVAVPDDLATLTASNLSVVSKTPADLRVSVTIAAKDGNYSGEVWLQIHNRGDYNNYITRFPAQIKLKNGGSTVVTLGGKFPQGVPGQYYTAYIYYTREGVETECSGRQRKTFALEEDAAIDEVTADASQSDRLYDLTGRPVASPRRGQIYISKNGTKIIY